MTSVGTSLVFWSEEIMDSVPMTFESTSGGGGGTMPSGDADGGVSGGAPKSSNTSATLNWVDDAVARLMVFVD